MGDQPANHSTQDGPATDKLLSPELLSVCVVIGQSCRINRVIYLRVPYSAVVMHIYVM